ncbi:hypothetical protein TSUD_196700 [Trifolium subterraneum]|uniref:F-box domain-containing protein n=1 Tax=Trifolium subterraneum TaxID=3900 RepID=A0A2Z6NXI5_TRISU|nr:hypothetical protein TSUD_196700 [Trifolium subterraneum]
MHLEEEKKMNPQLYLPHELIIQILLGLPVKSLTRFKCVCKSWFSLICDPHFANSHFQIIAATHTQARRILLMSTSPLRKSQIINFEASLLDVDSASISNYRNFVRLDSYSRIEIKGSCRGFLLLHCFSNQRMYWIYDIYLWNPSTGFHKKIPLSRSAFDSGGQFYTDCYGFGYDRLTDDYLLVRMSTQHNYNWPPPHLEIFSLRANTWKEIEGTQFSYTRPIGDEQPKAGFLFNGAIHWFAYCRDLRQNVIVAFDLMEKKLFNMHLPNDFDRELNDFGLWVFGEFLSIWAMYYFDGDNDDDYNHRLEIWVMKEYKVDSPWTKILVHSFDDISRKYFFPICSTKSGDIIGTHAFSVAKCDDKGQLLEYHSYFNDQSGCEVALYTESLFSLPNNEQD